MEPEFWENNLGKLPKTCPDCRTKVLKMDCNGTCGKKGLPVSRLKFSELGQKHFLCKECEN